MPTSLESLHAGQRDWHSQPHDDFLPEFCNRDHRRHLRVIYIYIYTVLRLFWAHEASVKIWIIITRLKFTAALNNVCHQPIRMVTNPPTPPTDTRIKSINDVTDVIHRPRISKVYWNTKQVFTFKKKSRLQTYGLPLPAHWSHGSVTKFQD